MRPCIEVLAVALRLGLTSFGGPSAHIGYFRTEYVERRRWLDDEKFAELLAVAQFLPGPTSSQLGAAIGYVRAGRAGAAAAWLGFTAPSAVAMAAFALASTRIDVAGAVWLHALKLVAVAVVLDAVLSMARTLTRTPLTVALAAGVAILVLCLPAQGAVPPAALAGAALTALVASRASRASRRRAAAPGTATTPQPSSAPSPASTVVDVPRRTGAILLAAFAVLTLAVVLGGPRASEHPLSHLAATMFGSGSLVFGGGHVVLALLQAQAVPDMVSAQTFLTGYGAAQALPGPLFTFATFLGQDVAGLPGAIVATVAVFLPGMLLLFGILPFWNVIRARPWVRATLVGVNAGVVGLLAAALVDPIGSGALRTPVDVVFAAALFGLLRAARLHPVLLVTVALAASPLLTLG